MLNKIGSRIIGFGAAAALAGGGIVFGLAGPASAASSYTCTNLDVVGDTITATACPSGTMPTYPVTVTGPTLGVDPEGLQLGETETFQCTSGRILTFESGPMGSLYTLELSGCTEGS